MHWREVGIADSEEVDGPITVPLKHFRPLGHESRDIGQFVDDDGTAYLIFRGPSVGSQIAKLSEDYMDRRGGYRA